MVNDDKGQINKNKFNRFVYFLYTSVDILSATELDESMNYH